MRAVAGGNDQDALLTEVQAADLLSLSVRTLQAWRTRQFGPPYVRAGRAIRYRRHDLFAWAEAQVVVHRDERQRISPRSNAADTIQITGGGQRSALIASALPGGRPNG